MGLTSLHITGPTEILPGLLAIPTGALVGYVHASGSAALDMLPAGMPTADLGFHTSVRNAIIAHSGRNANRANRGDTFIVLQGHTENVDAADNWPFTATEAGLSILGLGKGSDRPRITWTAAGSQVIMDQSSLHLDNMILNLEPGAGAVTVTAPLLISGAYNKLTRMEIRAGFSATSIVNVGITTTAGATDLTVDDLYLWADALAVPTTTLLRLVGAVRSRFSNVVIVGPGNIAHTIGPLNFVTTPSTDIRWKNITVINNEATGTMAITGMAANTGFIDGLRVGNLTDPGPANLGACWGTRGNEQLFDARVVNAVTESSAVYGTAST